MRKYVPKPYPPPIRIISYSSGPEPMIFGGALTIFMLFGAFLGLIFGVLGILITCIIGLIPSLFLSIAGYLIYKEEVEKKEKREREAADNKISFYEKDYERYLLSILEENK